LSVTYAVTVEALRRLAAAAHVATPGVEVRAGWRRVARVVRRPGGFKVVIGPVLLTATEPVLMGVLAHEVAHIALGHRAMFRRLRVGATAMIVLASIAFFAVFTTQFLEGTETWWLLAIEVLAWFALVLTPRAILLAIARREEFEADRSAATLLGSPDQIIAFLDWVSTVTRSDPWPSPLGLWMATHPSLAARREALLRRPVSLSGQSSEM
jgi:Zn-dependent protease with chaperone function